LSYQLLPNVIFILAVLGILLIILRHLPEAANLREKEKNEGTAEAKLLAKGLPAVAISKAKTLALTAAKKVWHFVLEAKDLKPQALSGYRIKKMFGGRLPEPRTPGLPNSPAPALPPVKDEKYFLDQIKLSPKNLFNYDALGRFYLEHGNFKDAKDIYLYLISHDPASADFHARLGFCLYHDKKFAESAKAYQKSVSLDSTQPNRYYNLSQALKGAGKLTDAKITLKHALALEPANQKYLELMKQLDFRVSVKSVKK
jgi:tetratricopeptide (TPR) repeat protein